MRSKSFYFVNLLQFCFTMQEKNDNSNFNDYAKSYHENKIENKIDATVMCKQNFIYIQLLSFNCHFILGLYMKSYQLALDFFLLFFFIRLLFCID